MVSIIIPVKEINDFIRESIPYHLKLDYPSFEIIIFPDFWDQKENFPKTRIIPTGKMGPAKKRDLALKYAQGEILAFIDDDAYPKPDWLKNAMKHFENRAIGAVGGPAVTPPSNNALQKTSGAIYSSKLGGGQYTYRYRPSKSVMEVDDLPTVNLLVRKEIFQKIGGFDSHYYPGEDTKLCLDIINLGKKIIYDPHVFVWHHRRSSIKKHFKQVWSYSVHRGLFMKKYPQTSFRFSYFIPSIFTLGVLSGIPFSFLHPFLFYLYIFALGFYAILLLVSAIQETIRSKNFLVGILLPLAIFLTHLTYGLGLLVGLSKKELKQ